MEKRNKKSSWLENAYTACKKTSQQLPWWEISDERLAVLKNVFAIILSWTNEDVEKFFEETIYE